MKIYSLLSSKLGKKYIYLSAVVGMFPWVSFGLNEYDTQPWFLILSLPIIVAALFQNKPEERSIFAFLAFSIFTILCIDVMYVGIPEVRPIAVYLSLGGAIILYSRFSQMDAEVRIRLLLFSNVVWISYALIQSLGLDNILPLVVSRTSDSRGVTSLATEPTFYALFNILEIAIIFKEKSQVQAKTKWSRICNLLIALSFIEIFFLSKSAMGILILFFIFLWYLFIRHQIIFLIALMFYVLGLDDTIVNALSSLEAETRPLQLAQDLIKDPSALLLVDQSINQRISSLYISYRASFDDFFVPHGSTIFQETSAGYFDSISWMTNPFENNLILSFIGSIVFEAGFISIFLFYFVFSKIFVNPGWRIRLFWLGAFVIVFSTAVPVGLPLVGYYVVAMGFRGANLASKPV